MTDVRVVLITAPGDGTADRMARDLVENRLAACVNVARGVTSFYRWEGRIEEDAEDLMVVKTTEGSIEALKARVVETHPYSVPEFIVLPVTAGSADYLSWVAEETGG